MSTVAPGSARPLNLFLAALHLHLSSHHGLLQFECIDTDLSVLLMLWQACTIRTFWGSMHAVVTCSSDAMFRPLLPCATAGWGAHGLFHCRHIHSTRRLRRQHKRVHGSGSAPGLVVHCLLRADYAATASDSSILQRPLKEELTPEEVRNVFDYPRNLGEKCAAAPHHQAHSIPD